MVTILILIDGFLQYGKYTVQSSEEIVTILILIDGFLQFMFITRKNTNEELSQSLF